ncbi:2-oxo acid dehydrogenase subunit E2, partial [Mesorhizobium sp. M4B.F.Ca.ET.049.02.1.2]|uniref:2-oxo acid dehydrogenase subunit E2 n=1 Tax=Mesorhizobium sp. M4B.F.Ca.ET.049.02.1.2 TaxID=2496752 RepID=UPI000FD27AA9
YGIKSFSAIVNPPQGAILAVGAGERRPVERNGELAFATLMTLTLSIDHRAVDGALGARLLGAIKAAIEEPIGLLV